MQVHRLDLAAQVHLEKLWRGLSDQACQAALLRLRIVVECDR